MPALADRLLEDFALGAVAFNGNIRAAYVAASGCDHRYPRISQCATELVSRPDVAYRIRELHEARTGQQHFTEDMHLSELAHIRDCALAGGNHGAALLAEKSRGEVAGFYKSRTEATVNHKYYVAMPAPVHSLDDWSKSAGVVPKIDNPAIDVIPQRVPA